MVMCSVTELHCVLTQLSRLGVHEIINCVPAVCLELVLGYANEQNQPKVQLLDLTV